MIIPTLQNGVMLENCVSSILKNGFDGDIYVVSHVDCISIRKFDSNIKFVYTGSKVADPTDTMIYKAYQVFDKKYDLMIYSHNDTVYHEGWWSNLKNAWESVDTNKVGIITVPASYDKTRITVTNPQQRLGLGIDIYNPKFTARFSPCSSFTTQLYTDTITKFGWDTYFGMELFISYEAIVQHKWGMMLNDTAYVDHIGNGDMGLSKNFGTYFARTYTTWFNKFGHNLEHFIAVWFGCVLTVHGPEIIDAVNNKEYDKVDYIFEGALKSIHNTDCVHCGLLCTVKNRVKQPYR